MDGSVAGDQTDVVRFLAVIQLRGLDNPPALTAEGDRYAPVPRVHGIVRDKQFALGRPFEPHKTIGAHTGLDHGEARGFGSFRR